MCVCVCACIYDMNYVQVSQKMCFHVILFAFVSAFLGILPRILPRVKRNLFRTSSALFRKVLRALLTI